MAERFNLTAQLQLQAPTNTRAVVTKIRRELKGVTVDVKVKTNVAALSKTNKELQNISKGARSSAKSVGDLNRTLSDAARRFSVITIATGTMLTLARAFKNSVGEAIAFERELVRISQVTGKTVKNLQSLSKEVTRLSTSLGASSKDLLNVSRVLAQAGFDAEKTSKALEILAQTSLGATFNSIQDTTEGAIAVLRQFRKEARAAGGEIKFLEQTLDAINAVSKQFAVESGDLITVIRRVGGVFEAAGGKVNELIALFTSVRATTRESAETIATGLRTIFTRIQRTETIDQLKNLGIVLRDSQGQFVGAYEAVNRLSRGLSALDPRDFRFSAIVEQLGGFRQIGKVIPLIRQFTTAQDALNVAQGASGSVARDAATAQQSLAVQIARLREDFDALIRKFADSSTFKALAGGALSVAKAFIKVAEALEPILPLITSLIALKIGKSLAPGLASIAGFGGGRRGRETGGRIHGFARGGFVPGRGNRDTVPAMLQPGEFVVRKSSASKLGSSTLEAMNNNRFKNGGRFSGLGTQRRRAGITGDPDRGDVRKKLGRLQKTEALSKDQKVVKDSKLGKLTRGAAAGADKDTYAAAFLRPEARGETFKGKNTVSELTTALKGIKGFDKVQKDSQAKAIIAKYAKRNEYTLKAGSLTATAAEDLEDTLLSGVVGTIKAGSKKISSTLGIQGGTNTAKALKSANIDQTMGNIFESVLNFAGAPFDKGDSDAPNAPFDYGQGLQRAAKPFGLPEKAKADAKTFFTTSNLQSLIKKVNNENVKEAEKELRPIITRLAAEGSISGGQLSSMDARNVLGLDQKANEEDIKSAAARAGYTATVTKGKSNTKVYGLKPSRGRAMGGKIDSVPALLTPGEYVVNKSSAQSIGYGNLNKMNQTGVQRFNTGGPVQRFANGGSVKSGDFGLSSAKDVALVNVAARQNATAFRKLTAEIEAWQPEQARAALVAFSRNINATSDEAVLLDKSLEAAHRSATQSGAGSTRSDKKVSVTLPMHGPGFAPGMSGSESRGPRAKLTGDKQAQLERISLRAAKQIEAMGISGKAAEKALVVYRGALKRGDKHHAAMNMALKAAAVETRKAGGALKRFRTKMSQVAQAAGNNLLGPKGQRGAQMVAGAQRGGEIAGQAQQFAFMASMIGSTAIQMSSLSNATKQAASETLGMATAVIGIVGTLAQMGTGIIANIAATKASAAAHATETGAIGKSSLGKLGTGFTAAAAGAAAVAAGFYYYSAKARAQADELAASTDEAIKKIKEGGGGSAEDIKADVRKEVALRGESGALKGAAVTAGVSGVAAGTIAAAAVGATSFAAAGAAAGSVVPIFGTLVGAGVGLAAGFIYYTYAAEEAAAAAEKEADALDKSVDRLVSLYQSAHQLDQALKDIDLEKDLTPEQRVKRRISALTGAGGADSSAQIASGALKALSQMATKAGVTIAQLDENTFADLPEVANRLKMNQLALADATEDVTKRLNTARATLVEARSNITGDEGSARDAIKDPESDLGNALKDVGYAINAQTKVAVETAKAQADSLRSRAAKALKEAGTGVATGADRMGNITSTRENPQAAKLRKEAEKLEAAAQAEDKKAEEAVKRGEQQKKSELKVTDDMIQTKKREKEQLEASIKAQEALRQATLKTEETMNDFVDQRRKLKKMKQAFDNTIAATSGTAMSFDRMAPEGLGDLSRVGNQEKFGQDIDKITAGESDEVKRMGQVAKDTARLLAEAKTKRVGGFAIEEKVGVEGASTELRKMLPDLEGVVGEDIFKGMAAELSRAAEDGVVSEEEWDKVFAPMIAKGKESAEGLQQLVDIQNQLVKEYQRQATALHKAFNDEIAVRQKLVDTQVKGAELRAQARGGSVGGGMKEASRQRRAQLGLIQRKPRGIAGLGKKDEAVATAGDVGSVSKAKDAAQKRLRQMAQEQRTGTFTQKQMVARGQEEARLKDTVKKTTAELARLADQTDRAADIMGEIDKERAKREQATSVITDFVVGGADQRRGMAGAAAGVGAAVRTGTLQNQTEDQRSATVGMLDKLSDVIIAGTGGLTGKQVKQELVFRDAVQMGLDPSVAKQLALGTSKEEQLINALDRLTHQMEQASVAAVGAAQGGMVYASRGASIFKPRGTDTVPAMLTPGEFVVRKSAVDKVGVNNLEALNHSRGGVVYRQGGGGIGSGNAQFVGQSKKVSIMGGDAYRGLFSDSLKTIGIKKFGELLEKYYPTEKAGEALISETGLGGASTLGVKTSRDKEDLTQGATKFRSRKVGKGKEKRQLDFARGLRDEDGKLLEERSVRKSMVRLLKAGKISLSNISIGEGIASSLDALVGSTDLIEKADAGSFSLRVPQFKKGPDGKSVEKEAIMAYRDRISSLRSVMQQGLPGGGDTRKIGLADEITMSAGNPSVGGKLITVANTLAAMEKTIQQAIDGGPAGLVDIEAKLQKQKTAIKPSKKSETLKNEMLKKAAALLESQGLLMAQGGSVPGGDTVPAMLTPGEFVMNKNAVQKHGVGFMKNLNRGRVPGFRRGGLVGTGNVQYKQDGGGVGNNGGGVISLDPSRVQTVLSDFNTNFSSSMDVLLSGLMFMSDTMTLLKDVMSGGLNLNHHFEGDMTLAFKMDAEAAGNIGKAVAEEMTPMVTNIIKTELDNRLDKDFKASG